MDRQLVFDLETKKTFDEVGGHHNAHLLEISVCGVYDYVTGKYRAYREEEFGVMEELFGKVDGLIGFNSISFDNTVLQPYFKKVKLASIPHLDILAEVKKVLGFRLKLESLAQSTLGEGKSGTGLDAIRYYREGDWDNLIKYCLDDVRVTKEIYEYGQRHGQLWYTNLGKLEPIIVPWVKQPTILEILAAALEAHQQVEIIYIKTDKQGTRKEKRVIDIRAMDKEKIRAYCNTSKGERIFTIAKIFDARPVGEMASYQISLI